MGLLNLRFDTTKDTLDKHEELTRACEEALGDFGTRAGPTIGLDQYRQRLRWELEIAGRKGFCTAFLVFAKWVNYLRGQGYMVGPGRGGDAGTLIAYLLGITRVDPIRQASRFPEMVYRCRTGDKLLTITPDNLH